MSDVPKIGKREMEALADCVRYVDRGLNYWWREASMKKLIANGFVALVHHRTMPQSFAPTAAGRAALAKARGETP